jgi:hypothetical protein
VRNTEQEDIGETLQRGETRESISFSIHCLLTEKNAFVNIEGEPKSTMNRGETVKRAVTILVAGGATLKAVHITLNDDWDSVLYSLKKSYKTLFDFDILKDVKPNYDKQKSKLPKVVILGTGWGAMSFLQNLDQDDVEITIVSPRSFFFYTPLLAGTAVGTVR